MGISQLLQTITNRLLHFSSVATRASVTFFCIIAFLCFLSASPASSSSPRSTWCSPPLSSACPCPPCSQATCSTPPSFLHPVCALFLLLPCLHKLHVRGQPLGDPASWG